MTDITIPSSIERLEEGAFFGCNLSTITLPSSVSYIGDKALCCNSLTSIICKSPIPPTAFNEVIQYVGPYNSFLWTEFWVDRDIPIHIPFGTTIAYQNASGWDYFNNFIETETNLGGEWYYEIQNDDGSITYQHLEYASDTTIGNQRPKVIVRSNTHYDRNEIIEITHEYVYEENGIVYWWNKDLEEFTTLYNLNAETGDEWTIKVGNNSLVMHVDAVENVEYEGQIFRLLHVSDPDDLFSGDIVCGIGHLTSFFPERLMNRSKGFRVDGLRCYWVEGDLVFKIGDEDCDAIYAELHNGIEETHENVFTVYPNPANDVLFIETRFIASQPDRTKYSITNLMGQTVMTGVLDVRLPQCDSPTTIDVSNLPAGMYFISVGEQTVKFVVR